MRNQTRIFARIVLLASCLLFTVQFAQAQGSAFTYQGTLNNNNAPGNGNFDFEFKLFDLLNTGIQQGAAVQRLNVPVTNGSFTVTLDFGAAVFTGAPRFLEISVRTAGVGVFTLLAPRQQITATPYAIKAANAAAADGLSAACVGCVTGAQIQAGGAYINNTTTQQAGANFNIGGDGTVGGTLLAAKVGVGTLTPAAKLDVAGDWNGENGAIRVGGDKPTIRFTGGALTGNQSWMLHLGSDGPGNLQFFRRQGPLQWGPIMTLTPTGNIGIGTISPGFKLEVLSNDTSIVGKSTGGGAGVYGESAQFNGVRGIAHDPNHGAVVGVHNGAGIGIYGESSGTGVVGKSTGSASGIGVYGESTQYNGVRGVAHNPNHGAVVGVHNNNGAAVFGTSGGIGVEGRSVSGYGVYGESGGTAIVGKSTSEGFGVYGESAQSNGVRGIAHNPNNGAVVGVHNGAGIGVYGESSGTGVVGKSTGSAFGIGIYGESAQYNGVRGVAHNSNHGAVVGVHNNGGAAVFGTSSGIGVQGETTSITGYGGYFSNTTGGIALRVSGTARVNILQITGGADFSENFDVATAPSDLINATAPVEPGMVVSIDPANPGKLVLSTQVYDRRVAGIISGAGGVKPGMVMSQEGTLAHGSHPVALSGRVYCLVDANQSAIEPGDLLTTSNTPGHAMKVTDPTKAQGAIIGKAMTGIKQGKGLVLVLVTLQ